MVNPNGNGEIPQVEDTTGDPDVVILHDSLFKAVKTEGLMRKERKKVLMKWCPKLSDALVAVQEMREKPKVVLIHSGTNDLGNVDENTMVETVKSIYDILNARGIKMVYDYILPRADKGATAKAEVVNSRVLQQFADVDDVDIARNYRFYWNGQQSDRLFEEDGIHINESGTKELVYQTKKVLCLSLGIEDNEQNMQPRYNGRNGGRNGGHNGGRNGGRGGGRYGWNR